MKDHIQGPDERGVLATEERRELDVSLAHDRRASLLTRTVIELILHPCAAPGNGQTGQGGRVQPVRYADEPECCQAPNESGHRRGFTPVVVFGRILAP